MLLSILFSIIFGNIVFITHIGRYDLDCEVLPGPMKSALFKLLEKRPKIKAVIMGTRRSDPYSGGDHHCSGEILLAIIVPDNVTFLHQARH